MQAKKVLSVLFESIGCGVEWGGLFCGADFLESAPFVPGGGTTAPYSKVGGRFV